MAVANGQTQPPIQGQTPVSLTDPSNMFVLQDAVLTNLNRFQTQYARYIRCQDATANPHVSPPCDVDGQDNFGNLNTAYQSLLSSIQDMSNAYITQSQQDKDA